MSRGSIADSTVSSQLQGSSDSHKSRFSEGATPVSSKSLAAILFPYGGPSSSVCTNGMDDESENGHFSQHYNNDRVNNGPFSSASCILSTLTSQERSSRTLHIIEDVLDIINDDDDDDDGSIYQSQSNLGQYLPRNIGSLRWNNGCPRQNDWDLQQ